MGWTNPTLRTSGELITANIWNTDLVDNLLFMGNTHDHSGDAGDGVTKDINLDSGVILIFDTSCPSGWTRVSAFDGLFLKGSSSYGTTGGGSSHSHSPGTPEALSYASVTYDFGFVYNDYGDYWYDSYTADAGGSAVYQVQANFDSTSTEPPYIEVIFCKKD